ncbi:hypothetical protein BD413DRAFT_493308 [Trametes elegans]|nr:hypothetical protein BD413DRAFT_493308 [Trametes elegans]
MSTPLDSAHSLYGTTINTEDLVWPVAESDKAAAQEPAVSSLHSPWSQSLADPPETFRLGQSLSDQNYFPNSSSHPSEYTLGLHPRPSTAAGSFTRYGGASNPIYQGATASEALVGSHHGYAQSWYSPDYQSELSHMHPPNTSMPSSMAMNVPSGSGGDHQSVGGQNAHFYNNHISAGPTFPPAQGFVPPSPRMASRPMHQTRSVPVSMAFRMKETYGHETLASQPAQLGKRKSTWVDPKEAAFHIVQAKHRGGAAHVEGAQQGADVQPFLVQPNSLDPVTGRDCDNECLTRFNGSIPTNAMDHAATRTPPTIPRTPRRLLASLEHGPHHSQTQGPEAAPSMMSLPRRRVQRPNRDSRSKRYTIPHIVIINTNDYNPSDRTPQPSPSKRSRADSTDITGRNSESGGRPLSSDSLQVRTPIHRGFGGSVPSTPRQSIGRTMDIVLQSQPIADSLSLSHSRATLNNTPVVTMASDDNVSLGHATSNHGDSMLSQVPGDLISTIRGEDETPQDSPRHVKTGSSSSGMLDCPARAPYRIGTPASPVEGSYSIQLSPDAGRYQRAETSSVSSHASHDTTPSSRAASAEGSPAHTSSFNLDEELVGMPHQPNQWHSAGQMWGSTLGPECPYWWDANDTPGTGSTTSEDDKTSSSSDDESENGDIDDEDVASIAASMRSLTPASDD